MILFIKRIFIGEVLIMNRRMKIWSFFIILALILPTFTNSISCAKVKIVPSKKTVYVGKKIKIKITGTKKRVKWSVSNKKLKITKRKNKYVYVKGVKAGYSYVKAKVGGKTHKTKVKIMKITEVKDDIDTTGTSSVYSDENISIDFDGIYKSSSKNMYEICFTIENYSYKVLCVQMINTSIDGIMIEPAFSVTISPGKTAICKAYIYGDYIENTDISNAEILETRFCIFDDDNWFDEYYTDFMSIEL